MKMAPLSADEIARLAALAEYKILDTAAESIFDAITALAAKVCDAPISLITLIDRNRQWFKSNYGFAGITDSSREGGFCAHAIMGTGLMEIPDARKDDRFLDNIFVLDEPHIRFYAGAPLINANGFKLGTLCVFDTTPRNLTPDQKEELDYLSKIVISFFEIKKALLKDIEHRKKAAEALAETNTKLKQRFLAQQQSHQELILLNEMSNALQACITEDEAYAMITKCCRQLFPNTNGELYLINKSHELVECNAVWGDITQIQKTFPLNDCLALRYGKIHLANHSEPHLVCMHMHENLHSICTPLIAQTDITGLLCLTSTTTDIINETQQLLAQALAEQIGLALANIKLRETLHQQSTHDPLTGLFNRRYLTETFKRELAYAIKKQSSLAVILIDIDHFKCINDAYGHEAGDNILCELTRVLLKNTSDDDLVCRYGGEEFIILIPNSEREKIERQAHQIQNAVREISVNHHGQLINITISMGIAEFPNQGNCEEDILSAADRALYHAKETGRNKFVIFS
jgi:diguanylate cyclase (GGDEF)-like protein